MKHNCVNLLKLQHYAAYIAIVNAQKRTILLKFEDFLNHNIFVHLHFDIINIYAALGAALDAAPIIISTISTGPTASARI